jgi:methionyl aminopeptidase
MYTRVKTSAEIAAMRESGRMLATVLQLLKAEAAEEMTTKDLAEMASRELKSLGGKPAFLGYQGFPDVLCVSVNDEVVHGIPSRTRVLQDGDVVSLDFGVTYHGMVTDSALTVTIGNPGKQVQKLVEATEAAMYAGIDTVKDGVRTGDIASAVQKVLDKGGYGIVRDLVGHGTGHQVHEDPNIPNYGHAGIGPMLKAGMTIAIEPMATLGTHRVWLDKDNWTVRTQDGSLAAHFEHTILITHDGAEILTAL